MKEVRAYVKEHRMAAVMAALQRIDGISGASLTNVVGFGRGRAQGAERTVKIDFVDYVPHMKLEIACPDTLVHEVVAVIEKEAHTGLRGDGKIYVFPIEDAVRISTGERGESAV